MILTLNNSFLFVSFLVNLWRLDVKHVDLIKYKKLGSIVRGHLREENN